jgi:hypothetical protein
LSSSGFENRYSFLDRALHRLAFRTSGVQADLADLEDRLYGRGIADVPVDRPVFVTGLPRAGTTLLLELLVGSSAFGSHTYRDMPFVLVPLLWSRFSRLFRADQAPQERAHGDGMMVELDSPEAFEEMVWKAHWKDRYRADRILPWEKPAPRAFSSFFTRHIRKVVALRGATAEAPLRYVSKNNANIARVECILGMLPDAVVVVPFREPIRHARSSLDQHLNFLEIHARDAFGRDYMAGVGHFDFGENLRPVDFGGWCDGAAAPPTTLTWWLEYWVAAYGYLLEKAGPRVHLFSYESLCSEPATALGRLAAVLGLDGAGTEALVAQGADIRSPRTTDVDVSDVSSGLLSRTAEIYAKACEASIV